MTKAIVAARAGQPSPSLLPEITTDSHKEDLKKTCSKLLKSASAIQSGIAERTTLS